MVPVKDWMWTGGVDPLSRNSDGFHVGSMLFQSFWGRQEVMYVVPFVESDISSFCLQGVEMPVAEVDRRMNRDVPLADLLDLLGVLDQFHALCQSILEDFLGKLDQMFGMLIADLSGYPLDFVAVQQKIGIFFLQVLDVIHDQVLHIALGILPDGFIIGSIVDLDYQRSSWNLGIWGHFRFL